MIKQKFSFAVVVTVLLLGLTSCDDEFTPNAEWREIPSVFCLLDQDDDTTYVRLQRCYLGDGNLYSYGSVADSLYYPAGEVEVLIRVWRNASDMSVSGATPIYVLNFTREMRDKVEGSFASGPQPVYCHRNMPGELDSAYTYELLVRRVSDGSTMASATTRLLGDPDNTYGWLKSPSPLSGGGVVTFNMLSGSCQIKWRPIDRGRLYQPRIRFYYRYRFLPDSLRYADIPCDAVKQTSTQILELTTAVIKEHYLNEIRKKLESDTNHKKFVDTVSVIMDVADENLNAYISSVTAMDGQDYQSYNNIVGGVGLFAARRAHLMERVRSDKGDQPNGMHSLLENLNVGFQQNDL